MVLKQIIVYSIGVFSMHYIMHFIDFNKFYKDNFLYREIRANVTLNKAEKVLKIKVDNLKIDFEMYDENFGNIFILPRGIQKTFMLFLKMKMVFL